MRRSLLLSLLIYGLLLLGLTTLNGKLLALALPLVVYLSAGLLFQTKAPQLKTRRKISAGHTSRDEPIGVTLVVTNEGSQLEEVLLEELIPPSLDLVAGQTSLLTPLKPGATVELTYRLQGERGFYQLPAVRVTASDHLGLFKKSAVLPVPGQFLIMPEVTRLRRVEIRPRHTRVYSGQIPARQGGPGVEFFGVREYQPGDPIRWINNRASARHPESLYVNEFEHERVADVGLILDARQQSNIRTEAGSIFEYSIQATAALADAFLAAGNRVGLFIYGRSLNWTFPGYGKVQRERILRRLAQARLGTGHVFEKLEHLPTRLFPARSQLVLVSPLLQDDPDELRKLRARGYRLLVISPDPIAFEGKEVTETKDSDLAIRLAQVERQLILRQLGQAGIRVMDWQVDIPFQHAAYAALRRFRSQ
jgi:uncharacterized protein (DUF58 family)